MPKSCLSITTYMIIINYRIVNHQNYVGNPIPEVTLTPARAASKQPRKPRTLSRRLEDIHPCEAVHVKIQKKQGTY